jgi:hypothetical protein
LDRYWNVIRTNEAAPRFFSSLVDLEARQRPRNLLDLMFDPAGTRPFVETWEEVAAGLLQRVSRESVGRVVDQKTVELLKKLEKYPDVKSLSTIPRTQSPVLPITFVKDGERFSYFSLITTVGTPQSITAQELRIECMFPLEPESKWQRMRIDTPITISDKPTRQTKNLMIGCLIFSRLDQIDMTDPFEVLSRIPNSTIHVIARTKSPIPDIQGWVTCPTEVRM